LDTLYPPEVFRGGSQKKGTLWVLSKSCDQSGQEAKKRREQKVEGPVIFGAQLPKKGGKGETVGAEGRGNQQVQCLLCKKNGTNMAVLTWKKKGTLIGEIEETF